MHVVYQYRHWNSITEIEMEHLPLSVTFYMNMGNSEICLEPSQTPRTEFFAKIVNGWNLLTITTKSPILDV